MINSGLFSSNTDLWSTLINLFNKLDHEFNFELDVCADEYNHKCAKYISKEQDGLKTEWSGVVWCNPPYGRSIGQWVKRCCEYSLTTGNISVMLLPARTDTKWWHNYVMYAKEIRFIEGRLKFGSSKNSAPFQSAIVIFKGYCPERKIGSYSIT